jgi:predicted component of type VI protein secretion system
LTFDPQFLGRSRLEHVIRADLDQQVQLLRADADASAAGDCHADLARELRQWIHGLLTLLYWERARSFDKVMPNAINAAGKMAQSQYSM